MMLVSLLSSSLLVLSGQPAAPTQAPARVIVVKRGLDQVTLKAHGVTVSMVMEKLKQEAQIESALVDPAFASSPLDGEWTAKDWDELLFVALSTIPKMKVLVAGGPEGTEWQVVGGSEAFLADFKLKGPTRVAEKTTGRSGPPTNQSSNSAADINPEPEVVEPAVEKTEEEAKEEQAQALATFTAIVSPPSGPPVHGEQVFLPFPDEHGNLPMATRDTGPLRLPFPGYETPTARKGPFPPSKDPAMQALIDIVNQSIASKK